MGRITRVKTLESATGTRPLDLGRPCHTMTDEELCRVIAQRTGETWEQVQARVAQMTDDQLRVLLRCHAETQ